MEINDKHRALSIPEPGHVPKRYHQRPSFPDCPLAAIIPCTFLPSPMDLVCRRGHWRPTPASRGTVSPRSPGARPCKELETRGGIWRV